MSSNKQLLRPPLRWAGSKFNLLPVICSLFPKSFNQYYEPMVGGGSVFFASNPLQAVLSDQNKELINYYIVLKDYPKDFIDYLLTLKSSKDTYYEFREKESNDSFERAVRFAYLNRLSWNGVYRVNKNGKYNVPFGGRTPTKLWSKDHLLKCAKTLRNAELFAHNYINAIVNCEANDFVFIDPPYPKGANNGLGFNRYNSVPFSLDHHKELAHQVEKLSERGVKVMLTLGNNSNIINLYPSYLKVKKVLSKTLISCNGDTRGNVIEVVLKNYN